MRGGGGGSVGHESGPRIVKIMGTEQADLTKADLAHLAEVVASCSGTRTRDRPAKDVETSRWCYSLMNWGHDRLKKT